MKKTITFFGLALLMFGVVSCKKDYTCTCEETDVWDGEVTNYEYSYTIKEAKKKQAEAACIEATIRNDDETSGDYYETTCELN